MPNTDLSAKSMGEIIAEIWNRTNAESTGVVMIPTNMGGFVVVDNAGREALRTVST